MPRPLRLSLLLAAAVLSLAMARPAAAAVDCSTVQTETGAEQFAVRFATGSTAIDDAGRRQLDRAARRIAGRFASEVCLVGRASRTGNAQANMRLSQQRIAAVRRELTRRNVQQAVLGSRALGDTAGSAGTGRNASGERSVTIVIVR